jgi:hypothetical protein
LLGEEKNTHEKFKIIPGTVKDLEQGNTVLGEFKKKVSLPEGFELLTKTGKLLGNPETPGTIVLYLDVVGVYDEKHLSVSSSKLLLKFLPPSLKLRQNQKITLKKGKITQKNLLFEHRPADEKINWTMLNLPAGLTYDEDGTISGIPTTIGEYTSQITAKTTDKISSVEVVFNVTYTKVQRVETVQFEPLDFNLNKVEEGVTSFDFIENSELPSGLELDKVSGRIHGIPENFGAFHISLIQKTQQDKFFEFTLFMNIKLPDIVLNDQHLEGGINEDFVYMLRAKHTQNPIWSALGLPAGLEIDAPSGEIYGIPVEAGDFFCTATVQDNKRIKTCYLSFKINESLKLEPEPVVVEPEPVVVEPEPVVVEPVITPRQTFTMLSEVEFSRQLELSLGTATSFKLLGNLPSGLNLDTESGTLFGLPTEAGSYIFEVEAINSAGMSSSPEKIKCLVLTKNQ